MLTDDKYAKIDELCEVLRQIDEVFEDTTKRHEYLDMITWFFKDEFRNGVRMSDAALQELFFKLDPLASENLIINDGEDAGNPDYEAMEELKGRGYLVTPGERDGFGWVTGIINARHFKHVFG